MEEGLARREEARARMSLHELGILGVVVVRVRLRRLRSAAIEISRQEQQPQGRQTEPNHENRIGPEGRRSGASLARACGRLADWQSPMHGWRSIRYLHSCIPTSTCVEYLHVPGITQTTASPRQVVMLTVIQLGTSKSYSVLCTNSTAQLSTDQYHVWQDVAWLSLLTGM